MATNPEMDRLRARIMELETELVRQKESYSRKSSVKAASQDPELEKLRTYIRQLEDELDKMRRQL